MIATYRKTATIDACRWDGSNLDELQSWGAPVRSVADASGELEITTLEDGADGRAKHIASLGDWIARGASGEFYAIKPEIFAATYEPVG